MELIEVGAKYTGPIQAYERKRALMDAAALIDVFVNSSDALIEADYRSGTLERRPAFAFSLYPAA